MHVASISGCKYWSPGAKLAPAARLLDICIDASKKGKPCLFQVAPDRTGRIPADQVAALTRLTGLAARALSGPSSPDLIASQYTGRWGKAASEELAKCFRGEWLADINSTTALMRTGFAFYDGGKYEDALRVFEKLFEKSADDNERQVVAMIWQGQMLDLLGRRAKAVDLYKKVLNGSIDACDTRHDQYGIAINRKWVEERLATPFARVGNKNE